MLTQIAFVCDRTAAAAAAALSPAAVALHQRGHYWLSDVLEVAIAALDTALDAAATRLIWWGRPDCDR